nr:putative reverse transcriptase domain-containing protein [Tanacetum cinerariifolium]
ALVKPMLLIIEATMGQTPGEMVVLSVEIRNISREIVLRAKGCHVFLAQISATKEDDKSEGKQVKDVPIVQDFPEVFLEDFPGLPPARPIEF